jgi:hypothetical protein
MTAGNDIPGLLWRLTVHEADGKVARGFPKIYQTEAGFKAAIRMQERLPTAWKRTMIKEGCARGPWLSLDGDVMPEGFAVDEFSNVGRFPDQVSDGWHASKDAEQGEYGLPPIVVFYEAA